MTESKDLIHFFFIERYVQAYRDQFSDFLNTVKNKTKPKVTFEELAIMMVKNDYDNLKRKI